MNLDFTKSLDLVTDENDFTPGTGAPFGSSQHFDFVRNIVIPGGLPDNVLSVTRASQALPESVTGTRAQLILSNKLMLTTAGLHVWEKRTNDLPNSFNFTLWQNRGNPILQDRNQFAPDGTLTASTVSVGAANTLDFFVNLSDGPISTNYQLSFFIKRVSTTGILRAQRTSSTNGQTGEWNIDMSLLPDRWIRLTKDHPSVTETQKFKSGTTGRNGLFFNAPDGIIRTFNLWGTQLEEGNTVSPYISTQGAAVTRFKDDITQPTSQLGFGAGEGMIVIDLVTPAFSSGLDNTFFDINNGVDNNQSLRIIGTSSDYRLIHISPGQTIVAVLTGISSSTRHKIALGWKADGKFQISVDGTALQVFGSGARTNFIPQTTFNLGSDVAEGLQLNSIIKSLTSYPDYSDALLQSRSA